MQKKIVNSVLTADYIVPPPRRRASPTTKKKKDGFAPYAPCGRSSRKPFINGSKGEGQHTAVAVCWKEDKNANVHVCVFIRNRRRPAAPPSKRNDKKIKNYFSIALRLT